VIVGIFVYMNMNSKSGSITIAPSTFSCSATTPVTSTIRLPSSLKEPTSFTYQLDGVPAVTSTVADTFTKQSDGSWLLTGHLPRKFDAARARAVQHSQWGRMSLRILDATGKVLAEGSYTR